MPEAAIEVGYWLSSEEHGARALVDHAVRAEAAGFRRAMISDHFHPWTPTQGHAPFVWGVLGAIGHATHELALATGVTAPILRMHPAVVAHAAATAAVLLEERFELGLGSGERLNEQIVSQAWPRAGIRRRMLTEAVDIIRRLLAGELVNAEGEFYRVEHAQLYSRPTVPPRILLAASGRRSAMLAGEIADGIISYTPDAQLIEQFSHTGGDGKVRAGQLHLCWAATAEQAKATAMTWWPNGGLPPQLNAELAQPKDFAAASGLVDEATLARSIICTSDPEPVLRAITRFATAGFNRVYLHQVGPDQAGFLRFWEQELRPALPT